MQCSWLEYGLTEYMEKDLTWNTMLYEYSEGLLKFCINATTNTLASPDNMRRWGQARNLCCGLCGQEGATLRHILAGCRWVHDYENKVMPEDRYTWRHNCVLKEIAYHVAEFISEINCLPRASTNDEKKKTFVKAGAAIKRKKKSRKGILHSARDWIFDFELPEWATARKYAFPSDVAITSTIPDAYIISRETKQIIVIELTAPLEENIVKWNTKKTEKYQSAIADACEKSWRDQVHVRAVEVGAKGWIPPSFQRTFKWLGFPPKTIRKLRDNCQLLARKCSYLIWINRHNKVFKPWRLTASDKHDAKWRNPRVVRNKTKLTDEQYERIRINHQKAKDKREKKKAQSDGKAAEAIITIKTEKPFHMKKVFAPSKIQIEVQKLKDIKKLEKPPKPTKAKAKKQRPLSILMSVKEEIVRSVPEDDYDEEAAFLQELKDEQAIADANEAIFEQHDWAAIPTQNGDAIDPWATR